MTQKLTIQDIANLAGVAKSTVSRYLNNGYVSKEKAMLIDKVIRETGYKSNFFAKRLKTKQSKLIGIVMPRLDSFSAGKLLTGFNIILQQMGYQALILISELNSQKELDNIYKLIQQGVDGIIVDSININDNHLKLINQANIPIIFTGQSHDKVNFIKVDDINAGKLMGEYIASLNHQQVVFLGVSPQDKAVGVDRYEGFKQGFLANNPQGKISFVQTDFSFEQAYNLGDTVVSFNPSAVICATDNIALGLLRYFHEKKIHVPQDISLAGFGGYPVGSISYPSLTSLAFDYKHLGIKTAEKLLSMLQNHPVTSEYDHNMNLIIRESTRLAKI